MSTVTAIFATPVDADRAIRSLQQNGFDETRLSYLAAAGAGAATFVPGVGPIESAGTLAGALVGSALGAAAGAAVRERHTHGVPNEDLYFYDEAMRSGQKLVIVDAHGDSEATRARNLLERAGGRSVHAVRQEWWQNVRESVRDDFNGDEADYRQGFEAALHPSTRGRDYDQCTAYIEQCYPEPCKTEAFRVGFNRGQDYFRRRMAARETE